MVAGNDQSAAGWANALPIGTRLGEFELRKVIGVGGFGIVYLAFDHGLEREVAIKEYMPSSLASRTAALHVSLTSPSNAETFALGLKSFVNEARLLARFDHPSLIKVHRFWEDRGTAYMVMPLYRGRTLRDVRQAMRAAPDEAWLRRLLDPLMGALEVLHRENVFHRDIAPDNIIVGDDGAPMLLDFGAARHVISGRSQSLTAILKPSYAPIEQYGESASLRQGAWTDLYALGATLHFLVTQSPPAPATARMVHEDDLPLSATARPGLSPAFLQVIDWMLSPRPADRPQTVAFLREVLAGRRPIPTRRNEPTAPAWQRTAVLPPVPAPMPEPEIDLDLTIVQPIAAPQIPPLAPKRTAPAAAASPPSSAGVHPPSPAGSRSPAPKGVERQESSPMLSSPMPGSSGRSAAAWVGGGVLALVVAAGGLWSWSRSPPAADRAQAESAVPVPAKVAQGDAVSGSPVPAPAISAALPSPSTTAAQPASSTAMTVPTVSPAASGAAAGTSRTEARPPLATVARAAAALPAPAASRAALRTPAVSAAPRESQAADRPSEWARPQPLPSTPPAQGPAQAQAVESATVLQRQQVTRQGEASNRMPRGYGTQVAPAPAVPDVPAAAPAVVAAGNPREGCGGRVFLALHACLVRQCALPQYTNHKDCVRVRLIEERARNTPG